MSAEDRDHDPTSSRVVRDDLLPLPAGREPEFSRPKLSLRERSVLLVALTLAVVLVGGSYCWNASHYIYCSDLLGTIWHGSDVQCSWRGSNLSLWIPKRDLPKYSGPIRQLVSGAEQVTVKGYVLYLDHRNSGEEERGTSKSETYWWRESGPPHVGVVGGPTLIVIEDAKGIFVSVTRHEFGWRDRFARRFKY